MIIDLSPIYKKYPGKWVGIKETKTEAIVLGYGKTIDEAEKMAKKQGEKYPILFKVPREETVVIGGYDEV